MFLPKEKRERRDYLSKLWEERKETIEGRKKQTEAVEGWFIAEQGRRKKNKEEREKGEAVCSGEETGKVSK